MKAKSVILSLLSVLLVVVPVALMAILGTLFFCGAGRAAGVVIAIDVVSIDLRNDRFGADYDGGRVCCEDRRGTTRLEWRVRR